MSDQLYDERKLRALTLIDAYSLECLATGITKAQVQYARAKFVEGGFGGRLIIAELTRDALIITSPCAL